MRGLFAARDGRPVPPPLRRLDLAKVTCRIPDRVGFRPYEGRVGLKPVGRPNDIFGDVLVSVPRLRFCIDL